MRALHESETVMISAATVTECLVVAFGYECEEQIAALLRYPGIVIEPVTAVRARLAAEAYRRYGKGWHAASLNFGDSFAYALAREHECPLLFIGDDFGITDIKRALD